MDKKQMTPSDFVYGLLNNISYFINIQYKLITSFRFDPEPTNEFLGSLVKQGGGFHRRVFRWTLPEGLTIVFLSNGETSIFRVSGDLLSEVMSKGFQIPSISSFELSKLASVFQEKLYRTVEKNQDEDVVVRYLFDSSRNLAAIEMGSIDKMFYESRIFLETDKINTVWI
jgi:hypothetical protein